MMSVLLLGFAPDGLRTATPGEAVRTLAGLVPAAVDGLVRDLCLAGPDDAGLAQVADHAGCSYLAVRDLREAFTAGARSLRSQRVLVTHAGTVVERAVLDEIASLLPLLDETSRKGWAFKAETGDFVRRLFPALAPTAGLVCSRAWLQSRSAETLAGLARQIDGLLTLKATALPAP